MKTPVKYLWQFGDEKSSNLSLAVTYLWQFGDEKSTNISLTTW